MATKTKAKQWLEVIDRPKVTGSYYSISKKTVQHMTDTAVDVKESYGSYIYIFDDGSSLYEKRKNDWYPAGEYIQCPECEQWREYNEADYTSDICAECDDEQATAILKPKVSD